jgi:predicted nucleic acid-binding protein
MSDDEAPSLAGPVVIDASSTVEYLVSLGLAEPATRLFRMAADGRGELWAPDLLFAESVSALRKLVKIRAIGQAPARTAVDHLAQLPISISGTSALVAAVWGMRAFLTPYDACYVALADALDAPFVTGEADLARELRKRGKRAYYLGDV